jgi:hypothetical protein
VTAGRALLGAGGVAVGVSLFVPFFPGVTGWEHWEWVDVVFAALAVALVAAAALGTRRRAVPLALAALCGLGIAVVLGHGFEPDRPIATRVCPGPYVALGGLAFGVAGALADRPRVLLVAAAAGLVAALFWRWGAEEDTVVFFGRNPPTFGGQVEDTGWERWQALDLGFVALAAGLAVAALRPRRAVRAVVAAGAVAAAACVLIAGVERSALWIDEGAGLGAPPGAVAALLALFAALAGLALVRPRGRAGRAG